VHNIPDSALALIQRAFLEHQISIDKQLYEERTQQLSLVRQNLRLKALMEALRDRQSIELSKMQAQVDKAWEKVEKCK
jgi:hypothetical protein